MIAYRPYNLIIPKFKIEESVPGGLSGFVARIKNLDFQEDEYLIGIGLQNATEVRDAVEMIEKLGLVFNNETSRSDDFSILAKEGIWWPVPWLIIKDGNAWFIADTEVPV